MLKSRDKAFHDGVGHFDLEHLYPVPMVFQDSFEERKLRAISFTNGMGFHMKRCIPCSSQQLVPPFAIYPAKSVKIDNPPSQGWCVEHNLSPQLAHQRAAEQRCKCDGLLPQPRGVLTHVSVQLEDPPKKFSGEGGYIDVELDGSWVFGDIIGVDDHDFWNSR